MKKFIIALAATTAIAAAAPAAAQYGDANVELRTDRLQAQLQAGLRSGAISRAEAMPLRDQLRQLTRLERQYSRGGFTVRERSDLRSRMASLRQGIRIAERGNAGRYGRDCPPGLDRRDNGCLPPGQAGRDDRNGRWGDGDRHARSEAIDRNRDGYDDRDLNRDRRIDDREWRMAEERYGDDDRYDRYGRDDDRYGRDDGRYEARDSGRGGLAGIVDQLLGRDALRVGDRVTADASLAAVPSAYRSRYRDGDGLYYRSDGRAIYQIDARNDTVLQIFGVNR